MAVRSTYEIIVAEDFYNMFIISQHKCISFNVIILYKIFGENNSYLNVQMLFSNIKSIFKPGASKTVMAKARYFAITVFFFRLHPTYMWSAIRILFLHPTLLQPYFHLLHFFPENPHPLRLWLTPFPAFSRLYANIHF